MASALRISAARGGWGEEEDVGGDVVGRVRERCAQMERARADLPVPVAPRTRMRGCRGVLREEEGMMGEEDMARWWRGVTRGLGLMRA